MEELFREIKVGKGLNEVYVEIQISVDENLKPYDLNLGDIKVSSIYVTNKNECFWDNLDFFFTASKEDLRRACKKELIEKDLYEKGIFKTIKELTKEVKRLNLYK